MLSLVDHAGMARNGRFDSTQQEVWTLAEHWRIQVEPRGMLICPCTSMQRACHLYKPLVTYPISIHNGIGTNPGLFRK